MNSIRKKAGFLEGLIASMKPDENDVSAQLNKGVVSLLSEMAERIEAMDELIAELNDYVESIDDDLTELEGIHDDEARDEMDDMFDIRAYPAEEHEPFRIIENAAEPEIMQVPARCPECAAVFLTDGGSGKYVCPVCEKSVKPQRLTRKNTPVARKAEK